MSSPTTGEGMLRISSLNLSLVIYFYCLSFVRLCIEGIEKVLEKTPSGVFRRRVFFSKKNPTSERIYPLLLDRSPFFKACPKREGTPYSVKIRRRREWGGYFHLPLEREEMS